MPKWVKGQSGNPAGRTKGGSLYQTRLRHDLEKHGDSILDALVNSAVNEGNVIAARVLLDRLLPATAPVCPIELVGTPAEKADQVLEELAAGKITAGDAKALLDGMSAAAAIRAVSDTASRLEAVEKMLAELTGATANATK